MSLHRTLLITFFLLSITVGCTRTNIEKVASLIESDLTISVSNSLQVLDHETYGWIEEGGDHFLLKVSASDCKSIAESITETQMINFGSVEHAMFEKNQLSPDSLSRLFIETEKMDFRKYLFDKNSCTLYLLVHWE